MNPPPPRRSGALTPIETLGLAALLAAVAAGAALWVAGQVAARLHAGVWLPTRPADMGGVLARLVGDPANPAAAWPPDAQPLLPEATVVYGVLAALLAAALVPTVVVWRRLHASKRDPAGGRQGARWATPRDLAGLRVRRPTAGRVTLGTHPRVGLLAAEPHRSVIIFGPTRSGKTTGFAIPAILEWDGPVLATSVKADLLADTLAHRRSRGDVWVYDPTRGTGYPASTWSPLSGCDTWQGALRTAAWLTAGVRKAGHTSGLSDGDFWYASAAKLLAPLLYAAATSQRTMADVVRWVDTQDHHEVTAALRDTGTPEAIHAFQATLGRHDNQRSSIYTTAETVVAAYADPAVAASANSSDINPSRLVDGGAHTLYVCAPREDQQRLRPLFTSLVEQALAAATSTALASPGGQLRRPLLVVLDEAANVAPLPELDQLASTAAGYGITLVTIWQDLAQIRGRYRDAASTIVNNHHALLALSGLKDLATLDAVSALIGDTTATRTSTTHGRDGGRSRTDAPTRERLLPPDGLRGLPRGGAVLLYGALPPARLQLRPRRLPAGGGGTRLHAVRLKPRRSDRDVRVQEAMQASRAVPPRRTEAPRDVLAIAAELGCEVVSAELDASPDARGRFVVRVSAAGRLLKLVTLRHRLEELLERPVEVEALDCDGERSDGSTAPQDNTAAAP